MTLQTIVFVIFLNFAVSYLYFFN